MTKKIKTLSLALLTAVSMASSGMAQSSDVDNNFTLELNKAENTENSCRLTYVATNKTGTDLKNTSYEVAIFDAKGAVDQLLVLEFGGLTNNQTRVVQFDIDNQDCENISKILVNNQGVCATSEGPSDVCTNNLATKTLAGVSMSFVD